MGLCLYMLPKQIRQPAKLLKPLFVQKKEKQSFFIKLDYTFVESRQSFDQTLYQDWTRKIYFSVSNTNQTKKFRFFIFYFTLWLTLRYSRFYWKKLSKRQDSFINKITQAKQNYRQLSNFFIINFVMTLRGSVVEISGWIDHRQFFTIFETLLLLC